MFEGNARIALGAPVASDGDDYHQTDHSSLLTHIDRPPTRGDSIGAPRAARRKGKRLALRL